LLEAEMLLLGLFQDVLKVICHCDLEGDTLLEILDLHGLFI
jgi:hypothetical protein